jgi:hypothetical protein
MDPSTWAARRRSGRWRRYRAAAVGIAFSAREMSDDELLDAIDRLRVGRLLAGPLAFATGAILLVVHGGVLLLTNWRLVIVELLPAVWLGAVLWDWRSQVLRDHALLDPGGWAAVAIAAGVVAMTVASYWCNVTFAYLATGREDRIRPASRAVGRHRRLVTGVALAVGLLHAWVAVRAPIRGVPTFAVGLGIVVGLHLYLYSALPAQALGIDRGRRAPREALSRTLTVGALSAVVSAPGILLALLARVLLDVPVLRVLGVLALALAVLVQVAATSSSRALSLATVVAAPPATDRTSSRPPG